MNILGRFSKTESKHLFFALKTSRHLSNRYIASNRAYTTIILAWIMFLTHLMSNVVKTCSAVILVYSIGLVIVC
jgi:hypothetical protein